MEDAATSTALDVSFDATLGGGSGADGLALVLADASTRNPTALGLGGGGLGFSGIAGTALALDTYQNGQDPSGNFIGLTNGPLAGTPDAFSWLKTAIPTVALRGDIAVTHHVRLYIANPNATPSLVVAELDGVEVLRQLVLLPDRCMSGSAEELAHSPISTRSRT